MRPKPLALAVLAVVLAAALAAAPSLAQKGPIKIGMLVPQSGPLAANGRDMINGFELFFEENKYRLAGREIKFIVEDDEGKPATGLTKIRGLVEGQGVHLITGPLSAGVGYAVAPYIDSKKIPSIFPIVAGDDLTQRKRSPYIVRVGWAGSQPSHPFGKWVYDNLKYKRIAVIAYDFAFGWEVVAGRSCRSSGRRSAPRTSRRTSRSSSATSMPSTRSSRAPTLCASASSSRRRACASGFRSSAAAPSSTSTCCACRATRCSA
jgi:branched-chain amino acid transport system substrate-binding protein